MEADNPAPLAVFLDETRTDAKLLASAAGLNRLLALGDDLQRAYARNTQRAWVADWRVWIAYCARTGRTVPADWPYFMAFVLFRMAAILQGVYKRSLQGNASSAHGASYGAAAGVLAERACEVAGIRPG